MMAAKIFFDLNYASVFLAGTIYFLLGLVWYSPRQFSQTWMRLNYMDPERKPAKNKVISMAFISTILSAVVLAFFIRVTGASEPMHMLTIASVAAAAVTASSVGMSFMFVGRELKPRLIDTGYHLAGFMVMAMIMHVM